MHITIINGPNLNLLGTREPEIYGSASFTQFLDQLRERYPQVIFEYFQSNSEGALIDRLQQCLGTTEAVILNAAAYTHTSIALADTLRTLSALPVIEVHISNIHARESFRQHSYTAAHATGVIAGLGLEGYALATQWLLQFAKP